MSIAVLTPVAAGTPRFAAMMAALAAADLPTSDVFESDAEYFALADDVFGGLVPLGSCALLRSLVVAEDKRGSGVGSQLLHALLALARAKGVTEAWLLTTSAEAFFARHGFVRVDREAAPAAVATTGQFKGICPASAALMRRSLL
jgi:amino-acid N-acetyltransferase